MNKELFFLLWDAKDLYHAAKAANSRSVPFAQCQLWVRERQKQKALYRRKVLRQARNAAIRWA